MRTVVCTNSTSSRWQSKHLTNASLHNKNSASKTLKRAKSRSIIQFDSIKEKLQYMSSFTCLRSGHICSVNKLAIISNCAPDSPRFAASIHPKVNMPRNFFKAKHQLCPISHNTLKQELKMRSKAGTQLFVKGFDTYFHALKKTQGQWQQKRISGSPL